MGVATFNPIPDRRDTLRGTLVASLLLHGLLVLMAAAYTILGLNWSGAGKGNNWGQGGAVRVNAVASLPGVPLPTPQLATPNTLATQNPGLYQSEIQPKLEPPPEAKEIPKFKETVAQEKPIRVNKRIQQPVAPPDNAIPYGLGGKPSMNYNQFTNTAGGGGLSFGEGNFGDRFGWYVDAVRNRISNNWLLATISPNILTAPRVYVHFDVLRDGTVTNVAVTQTSGNPEIDRSAIRAVLASNPLGPLPPAYSGNKVTVEFFFDFRRR
jgi:periplasmic protein TonB